MRRLALGVGCLLVLGACQKDDSAATTAAIGVGPAARPVPKAYSAEGGADDFHGAGTICDLSKPFSIGGGGVIVVFTPSSPSEGSYSYKGALRGVAVFGAGTYEVKLEPDGRGGEIKAKGPGSVKTPMGVFTKGGTEKYTLTPAVACP